MNEAKLENVVSVPWMVQRVSVSLLAVKFSLKFRITDTEYPVADNKSAKVRQTISFRVKLRISGMARNVAIISIPPITDKAQLVAERIRAVSKFSVSFLIILKKYLIYLKTVQFILMIFAHVYVQVLQRLISYKPVFKERIKRLL